MKKRTLVLIAVALGWNLWLSVEVMQLKQNALSIDQSTKVVREVVTNFTSDITEVVADVMTKVVGVASIVRGQVVSTGSGFVYQAKDGKVLVITNNHVVAQASEVTIRFANGQEKEAKVVGTDLYSDLALLETSVDFAITAIKLGDSSEVKIGEIAIAIGNPLGFEFQGSTTQGIISGKDRVLSVDLDGDGIQDWDMTLLQTDAAINPGNSGGPLINAAGELIGINSLKIIQSQVEGLGFAIPVNEMVPIIEQLEAYGSVRRPTLGISARAINEMNSFERNYYGVAQDAINGLFIIEVMDKTPAAKSGLNAGDVLLSFDGKNINTFKDFRKQLYSKKINDQVKVVFMREGKTVEITIILS